MAGLFISATGTDLGKTFVSGLILKLLNHNKIKALPFKPLESGAYNNVSEDINQILQIANLERQEISAQMSYKQFKEPCSPHFAAELENEEVIVEDILKLMVELQQDNFLLTEGAGGVLVPYTRMYSVRDLISESGLPVILVSSPFLGTISHTLTAIESLLSKEISINGIVFSYNKPSYNKKVEADSIKTIKDISGVEVLGVVPYIDNFNKNKLSIDKIESFLPGVVNIIERLK